MNNNILCITPIDHLENVSNILGNAGNLFQMPLISSEDLYDVLRTKNITVIFTNPNMQGFKLNKHLLHGSNVSTICTASTGLNHIEMEYCDNNNIQVISITRDYELLKEITSTAEHAFGLLLSSIRKTVPANFYAKNVGWDWRPFLGRQLKIRCQLVF